jgi:hypothetical protein
MRIRQESCGFPPEAAVAKPRRPSGKTYNTRLLASHRQVIRDTNKEAQTLSKLARPLWLMFWKEYRRTVERGGWMRFKGQFTARELAPQTEGETIVFAFIVRGLQIAREWKRWSKSTVTWVAEVMEMAQWIEKTFRVTKRSLKAYRYSKKRLISSTG